MNAQLLELAATCAVGVPLTVRQRELILELANPRGDQRQEGECPADWDATLAKLDDDWGLDAGSAKAVFNELLPFWLRDPSSTHIWLPIDALIRADNYGVHGSDFYGCRLCDAESGAGMLNQGIPHQSDCPLHDDNFGKPASPPPEAAAPALASPTGVDEGVACPICDGTGKVDSVRECCGPPRHLDEPASSRADDVDREVRSGRKFYFRHNPANTMLAQIFNDILRANGTFAPGITENQRREDAALAARDGGAA